MKILCLLLITAWVLAVGCDQSPNALRAAGITMVSATYGSGTNFADVTVRVNDLLRPPGAEFSAQPKALGADPSPGWNKVLVIVYERKHRRCLLTAGEGDNVNLPALLTMAGK